MLHLVDFYVNFRILQGIDATSGRKVPSTSCPPGDTLAGPHPSRNGGSTYPPYFVALPPKCSRGSDRLPVDPARVARLWFHVDSRVLQGTGATFSWPNVKGWKPQRRDRIVPATRPPNSRESEATDSSFMNPCITRH